VKLWGTLNKRLYYLWTIIFLPLLLKLIQNDYFESLPEKLKTTVLNSILTHEKLRVEAVRFFFTVFLLHLLFGLILWLIAEPSIKKLVKIKLNSNLAAILIYLFLSCGVLAINTILFPASSSRVLLPYFFIILSCLIFLFLIAQVYFYLQKKCIENKCFRSIRNSLFVIIIISVSLSYRKSLLGNANSNEKTISRPNIILIGIDGLRPDHLGSSGEKNSLTPFMDKFLRSSLKFKNTYTPFARTYPAWISILTGRYPVENGARDNLVRKENLISFEKSLPYLLKENNYFSVYAIDETRFSNIDVNYGFDRVISPAIGAADFVLAGFADLPLCNLLQLAPSLYSFFFPYQFINRAAFNIYHPENFNSALDSIISNLNQNKPLFLVTHFELAHWPYIWGSPFVKTEAELPERLKDLSEEVYQQAIAKVDSQFQNLLESLSREHRLDNAIVVLLSDHGESFQMGVGNGWVNDKSASAIKLPPFSGHGINVIDETQTKVILAFRTFGSTLPSVQGESEQLASLVDILPTVTNLAKVEAKNYKLPGCNLLAESNSQNICDRDRVVFTESGFYPRDMFSGKQVDQFKVAAESYKFYDINEDGRLTLKPDELKKFLKTKQRAVISGRWLAASLPDFDHGQFIISDLKSKVYYNLESFDGNINYNVPNIKLFGKLCEEYKGDDESLDSFCAKINLGGL
jgi:arylsulfatase A-like enzyme